MYVLLTFKLWFITISFNTILVEWLVYFIKLNITSYIGELCLIRATFYGIK